jgi:hypothetical protein
MNADASPQFWSGTLITFCNRRVQEVLLKRHPETLTGPSELQIVLPVYAWSVAQRFVVGGQDRIRVAHRVGDLLACHGQWMTDLLDAQKVAFCEERDGKTAPARLRRWSTKRALEEPLEISEEEEARYLLEAGYSDAEITDFFKVAPAEPAVEPKRALKKKGAEPLNEERFRPIRQGEFIVSDLETPSPGAFRKALLDERKRYQAALEKWRLSWTTYLASGPVKWRWTLTATLAGLPALEKVGIRTSAEELFDCWLSSP